MDFKEIKEGIVKVQNSLKDGIETHNGLLLSLALRIWKEEKKIHVLEHNYTVKGITAKVWLPMDKKKYRITIEEEK